MNKKVILFDADGVVIRTEFFSVQYGKKFGLPPEKMLAFFNGIFQNCLIGKADLKKVIKPYLRQWKWDKNVDDFLLYWFKAEDKPDKRVINLVKELRKNAIHCYLATNQEKYRTEYIRNQMGFGKIFNGIFSSAEIGSKKPQQIFYEHIFQELKKHGFTKDQIMLIDDRSSHVDGAKKAGIDACLYTEFKQLQNLVKPLLKNHP